MSRERKHAKRHAQAWDAPLTDEQRDAVFRRATTGGFRWEQVLEWVAEEYGLPRPGRTAFYRFLDYWRPTYVARRTEERILAREALRAERAQVGDMSPEIVQALEDEAQAWIAKGDLTAGERLFRMAGRIREDLRKSVDQELRRAAEDRAKQETEIKLRRLALLEAKLKEAQDQGATVDPAALADEIDRVLGRQPQTSESQ